MAWAAIVMAVISAASQMKQGQQAEAMGDWQLAQANADAQAEREAGMVRAEKIRQQGGRDRSAARAALSASGVDTGAGTPIRIEGEIARSAEEDALNEILYGKRRGTRLEQEGQLAAMAGDNRASAATTGAFGSLLSMGGRMASGWRGIGTQSPAPVRDGVLRIN